MDLITPGKSWLRGLSKDELIAMLETGRDPECGGFYRVELNEYEYTCPRLWIVQEHKRRMMGEVILDQARSVMAEFSQYFEKCIKPEHRRKKS